MNCPNPHCYNGSILNAIGEVAGICPTCSGFSTFNDCTDRDADSPAPTVAQPAAEQQAPVGADEPLLEVVDFLLGAAPLEGVWFGEKHPKEPGSYWWRSRLRDAVAASPPAQPASIEPAAPDTEAGLMEALQFYAVGTVIDTGPNPRPDVYAACRHGKTLAAAYRASEQRCRGLEADAGRLDWLFSELHDEKIAAKLKAVADAHAMGGGYRIIAGKEPIRMGDFRAAIDAAINSAKGGKAS